MNHQDLINLKYDLYKSFQTLQNLNLYQASKWCTEAINGMSTDIQLAHDINLSVVISPQDLKDYDRFIMAKSFFQCKEFDRCSHTLKSCTSSSSVFLKLYSNYLSIDKRDLEEADGSMRLLSSSDTKSEEAPDSKLLKIVQEIEQLHQESHEKDPFLLYLLGLIYNKRKNFSLSQTHLIESLKLFPYNWSCWQELVKSLTNFDEASQLLLQLKESNSILNKVIFKIFEIVVLQEFYQVSNYLLNSIDQMLLVFPQFNFLKVQKFLVYYHQLDYFQAEQIFDKVLIDDPLRLDDLDTYSNMLYVMEKKSKLSFLAQYSSNIDKYRPETCCIIANFHSMKGEHEKAIMYYKRALILNKNSLSAWTLMGHEFVELKNSHAAIESYRRGVDINPKDFRAWYGLGQAYEVLDMHLYSLYYYQRATNLQPLDKRMWQAIGNCYEKINKDAEAIKSFEKALSIDISKAELNNTNPSIPEDSSYDPSICFKLACIYEKIGNIKQCTKYMKLCYEREAEWGVTDDISKARLWLARLALEQQRYEEAYNLTKELNHNNAHDIEEARAIAREARNRMAK